MSAAKAWQDPSLGPREGKTYQAMLDRREQAAEAELAGTPWPSNLDPIEVEASRLRNATRTESLKGQSAGEMQFDGTALVKPWSHKADCDGWTPSERAQGLVQCTGCATDEAPDPRADLVAAIMCRAAKLSHDDLLVVQRVLDLLPYERLKEKCQAIADEGREPAVLPDGSLPANPMASTPHEHYALGTLLGAIRDLRRLVLGPEAGR